MQSNFLELRDLVTLDHFLNSIGRTRTTGWRWRKRGWLKTIDIAGRPYVTRQAHEDFMRRAEAGEFSKQIQPNGKAN